MARIGIRARGTLQEGDLATLSARLGSGESPSNGPQFHEGALHVELHPCAEPLRITLAEGEVELEAHTATAGPGFHAHVCELIRDLPVDWAAIDDDAGFFASGDRGELEEVFLDWLGAGAAQILELIEEGASGFALGLPPTHRYSHDGVVATLLGPRDEDWLRRTRDDARGGIDVFAWWSPGRDAAYYRGLALSRMWTEVRWRPPITDDERALLEQVVTWVEKAHGLDPELDLPWPEQSELFGYLEEQSLRATRAHVKAEAMGRPATIGYRRRPVRAILSGGWSLSIDGAFAERWEERGTWVAWDARRSVHFTSLSVRDADGRPSPDTESTLAQLPPLEADEVLALEAGEVRGIAAFFEDERDGQTIHRLEAQAAQGEHAAVGTLTFVDPRDRQWALETWGSLYRQTSGTSARG